MRKMKLHLLEIGTGDGDFKSGSGFSSGREDRGQAGEGQLSDRRADCQQHGDQWTESREGFAGERHSRDQ